MPGSRGDAASGNGEFLRMRRVRVQEWLSRRQHPIWGLALRLNAILQAKLSGSAFTRNVSVLLVSTIIGQVAGVVLSPLLTRIFSPEQFGVLSVYSSVLLVLSAAACLRYEIAIPLSRDESEAANLVAATGLGLLISTVLVSLACWLAPDSIFDGIDKNFHAGMRVLLPAGLFVIGLFTLLSYTATWAQNFAVLARARISQGVSGPISQITLGLLGLGSAGLALGFVVGQSAGTTLLFKRIVIDRWDMMRRVTLRGIGQAIWKYRSCPLISAWATVIDALGAGALLYFLVARYYPGPAAGFLFLSERVVARPLVMISNSMLTVYVSELGRYMTSDPVRLRARVRQITSKQFLIGLVWVLLINSIMVVAFPFIFGRDWAAAVPYLLVISASHLATSVIQSVSNTLQTLNRQALAASWQIGRVVAIYLGFLACHQTGASALTAITVYSGVQVVGCLIMYLLTRLSVDQLCRAPVSAGY